MTPYEQFCMGVFTVIIVAIIVTVLLTPSAR